MPPHPSFVTCTNTGLGVRRHLWDFSGTFWADSGLSRSIGATGLRGYAKTASMAVLPRAPARGGKCAYFRSVKPGSEWPSHRARETTDSPTSHRTALERLRCTPEGDQAVITP